MNLIDFHVTKIISEKIDKLYCLLDMTYEEVQYEDGEKWKECLLSDGMKQTFEYWDDGGVNTKTEIFSLKHRKPYYVGYVGQH